MTTRPTPTGRALPRDEDGPGSTRIAGPPGPSRELPGYCSAPPSSMARASASVSRWSACAAATRSLAA